MNIIQFDLGMGLGVYKTEFTTSIDKQVLTLLWLKVKRIADRKLPQRKVSLFSCFEKFRTLQ